MNTRSYQVPSPEPSLSDNESVTTQDFYSLSSSDAFPLIAKSVEENMTDNMDTDAPDNGKGKGRANQFVSQQTTNVTLSLNSDQLQRLLAIIDTSDVNQGKTLRPNPHTDKKKASSWPEWDGSREMYPTYIIQLTAKIEADWDLLGGHKAVCMDMMNTIPKNLRSRVSHWYTTGGPDNNWDYELYLEHFNDNFEDKTSVRTANEKLSRMRQGKHQTFASYLNDFEHMLTQARGINWEGYMKINGLSLGLNESLTKLLMPCTLSETNYTLFVRQVRNMASKLESQEDYIPKHGLSQTKTWYISRLGVVPHKPGFNYQAPASQDRATTVDTDGDTPMSGVSGLSTCQLAAIINAVNSKNSEKSKAIRNKPPAPWKTPEEFAALRAAGKCTRCEEKGHYFKKCPNFTWAKRPSDMNAVFTKIPKNSKSRLIESDEDEDEFGNNVSGNE